MTGPLPDPAQIVSAARLVAACRHGVALTGAGISTESGLPDFRSRDGLWQKLDPMRVATLTAFHRTPEVFYEFYRERLALLRHARPNPAHLALAYLQRIGRLRTIITQNVDGLHQAAGAADVVEVHGNLREAVCVSCRTVVSIRVLEDQLDAGTLPTCWRCNGKLKPNVVLFEEMLPPDAYQAAEEACRRCDLLVVVGSSLQVTPVSFLPGVAAAHGAALLIVNAEPTPADAEARVVLRGQAGSIRPALVERVEACPAKGFPGFGPN
ncbi:MAG: NAD-dependent deacylase [Armatimonadetes bacterium]|nr:NAD-dependent deacylase [Armatimonadota bacterium]